MYWRDASHNTLGCISQYTRLVLEGYISHTLDYCIGGMHLTIHPAVAEGFISQSLRLLSFHMLTYYVGGMDQNVPSHLGISAV